MAGGTQPWRRTFGLCGPPVLLSLTDWTLTALGQPAAYWAGDYSRANELSPTFHNLLAGHPALFALGVLAWVATFVALIVLLPDTPAVMLSLAVAFGHANGASWQAPAAAKDDGRLQASRRGRSGKSTIRGGAAIFSFRHERSEEFLGWPPGRARASPD